MDKKNEKLNVEVFDYSTIPKFIQERGKCCLWKLKMKTGKAKPEKIPYQLMFTSLKRCREQELRNKPSVFTGTSLVQLISQQTKKKRHNLHCRKLCRLFQRLKIPN